ncbi:hypothetical protein [uncultured Deinococcus sp.]|uniref:hypothetical protein n=1 Tax=uncultured Deinococcus sp. TaxID=158789 RepID=UPI0025FFB00A|nr:hypothetical protein [uncultured Deinococcus sp.]
MHPSPAHPSPTRLWIKAAPAPVSRIERLTVQPGHLVLAAAAPGLPVAWVAFTGDAHDPARRWTLDRGVRLAATEADLTARDAHTLMFRDGETPPARDTVAGAKFGHRRFTREPVDTWSHAARSGAPHQYCWDTPVVFRRHAWDTPVVIPGLSLGHTRGDSWPVPGTYL